MDGGPVISSFSQYLGITNCLLRLNYFCGQQGGLAAILGRVKSPWHQVRKSWKSWIAMPTVLMLVVVDVSLLHEGARLGQSGHR